MARVHIDHYSQVLGLSTQVVAVLPDVDDPPLLYLLHGLSDDATCWSRNTNIERYATERGIAVVMPQVGRSFYTDEAHGLPYWTYLIAELPALVGRYLRVTADPARTFVAGLSMGGYGALKWALNQPERFAAAASISGALDVAGMAALGALPVAALDGAFAAGYNADTLAAEARRLNLPSEELRRYLGFDLDQTLDPGIPAQRVQLEQSVAELRRRLRMVATIWGGAAPAARDDVYGLLAAADPAVLPRLFISCGTEDPLLGASERFVADCRERGVTVDSEFLPGKHWWPYWDDRIQRVLDWVRPA